MVEFMNEAVLKAIEVCGSAAKLAERIGKSQQFVYQMRNGRKPIPAKLAPVISSATGGIVSKSTLRPDLWDHLDR